MRRSVQDIYQLMLDSLENVEADSNGYNARCPCHDDRTNSLNFAISNETGNLVFDCKAGCNPSEIAHELGFTMYETFADSNKANIGGSQQRRGMGRVVKEYDYRDVTGEPRFQVCRMEPKDFRQRRPDGEGGWIWGLTEGYYSHTSRGWFKLKKGESPSKEHRHFPKCEKLLYRLPELTEANPAQPVYLVEGEKDVDRLRDEGCVATCNPGGGGKWIKAYNEHLRNRHLIIIPDNDKTGDDHATLLCQQLGGVAASIKVIRLVDHWPEFPEHGDVYDYLEAHSFADLQRIIDQTEPFDPRGPAPAAPERAAPEPEEITNGIKDGETTIPVHLETIYNLIDKATDGWPRRVGETLFVCDKNRNIHYLPKQADFFSYIGRIAGPPKFYRSPGLHTKEEVFKDWWANCPRYGAIEMLPHEPTIKNHYYAHEPIKPGDGSHLEELLNRFSPYNDNDRDMIKAMFATPLWGGGGGKRPAFVITSDAGRGVGKSTMIGLLAELYGGLMDLSPREDMSRLKERLLSPEATQIRIAVLDNVKTLRFSWGELESLITAPTISGRKMYVGEARRPNTFTYLITLNGVNLSTDIAQRSVIIKLRKPTHSGDWEQETRDFIEKYKTQIIGDLIAFLRQEPTQSLPYYSRWGLWEKAIIERLPYPDWVMDEIRIRQEEADVEREETDMIEDHIREKIEELNESFPMDPYNTDTDKIFIPSRIMCEWYREVTHERNQSDIATSRQVNQRIDEGAFTCIQKCKSRKNGRGYEWQGCNSDAHQEEPTRTDLQHRLDSKGHF